MTTDRLSGEMLRRLFLVAAAELEENRSAVDALNVFPVPDGDTGTNMNLTMQAAIREMAKCQDDKAAEIGKAIALGSLMGARGNSGVILSQLFRGIGRGFEGHDDLSALDFAQALQSGVETAYKAVMRPVEGTILTVAREMARSAIRAARGGSSIPDVLLAAKTGAEVALARTPDLLPVLKQAGVVDAGGKGLVVILKGMVQAIDTAETGADPLHLAPATVEPEERFRIDEDLGEITYAYDTQVLVRGSGLDLDRLRDQLGQFGDSMLVVGTLELAKVHIHTNNPGLVLEACLGYGTLTDITVENMREQYEAIRQSRAAGNGESHDDGLAVVAVPDPDQPQKQVGIVTVAVGDGLDRIFRSLGADVVINGGQTMNPSTEELVRGIEAATRDEVMLLPNNSNILMAARQAVELTQKKVAVVPSRNIPQGISALLAYNPQNDLEANKSRMTQAMEEIRTGEITYAVRSTRYNGWDIAEGDILAIVGDEIQATGSDPLTVLEKLLASLVDQDSEFVTLLYGSDVTDEQAEAAAEMVRDRHPNVEVECHRGGQPLFYYLVSVE